jgi:methanethiol S-methyltransferase
LNKEHWLLLGLWILYCLVHSIFAINPVKRSIQKILGKRSKFYRPVYSIFALLSLILILWYQFSIRSKQLFFLAMLRFIPGIVLALPGILIMIICIRKYFYELSGLQALQQQETRVTLQQQGLHKFVRHPLYLGTLLFIWGILFIFPFLNNLIGCIIITLYTLVGMGLEEKKLKMEFGDAYREYAKKVPKLIPGF